MDSLSKTSENLDKITTEVKSGKGLLNALIYDPAGAEMVKSLSSAAKNLAEASSSISELGGQIKNGQGVAHHLIYGESPDVNQKISDSLNKVNEAANSLERATRALANGEGTIGALLVDPSLYENLVQITDGANRSFILRQAIRTALKDGKDK